MKTRFIENNGMIIRRVLKAGALRAELGYTIPLSKGQTHECVAVPLIVQYGGRYWI